MKALLVILMASLLGAALIFAGEVKTIGNPNYIHLQKDDGTWWFVDHSGKRFITTGMNHVDEGWMQKQFGDDIKAPWVALNGKAENIGAFADMVVADFKDYGFNTIPFQAYNVPLSLYFDMPDLKSIRKFQNWMFPEKGLIYPWVQDMR